MTRWAVLFTIPSASCASDNLTVTAAVNDRGIVTLEIVAPYGCDDDTCIIYRSHVDINLLTSLDLNEMPITKSFSHLREHRSTVTDSMIADNCTYYYYVKTNGRSGKSSCSPVCRVHVPDRLLPIGDTRRPSLFIDKVNYFIELRFNGIAVKRYPVSFGRLPRNRKLCYDQRSTPEGVYHVEYRRPKATFYKALGVSYPNATDYKRYREAVASGGLAPYYGKLPSIGGSIQIHGGGVDGNWTWGCIAMRNGDIDELFTVPTITTGTPIYIVGVDVSRKDIAPYIHGTL